MVFYKKCRRAVFAISLFIITFLLSKNDTEAVRDRGARCEKPDYIPNGSYRVRRDRVMRINCNSGFILQGSKTVDCVRGKWDGEKPVCAKKGCKKGLDQLKNGRIQIENEVKAILYCSDNYNLAGNRHSYCNGSHWDRPIGNCREHKNIVQHECDFETDDICGWTYEPREGLEWKRVMAANVFTTFKTGPRHDHTTLTANGGHYMLMESLTRQNDDITLTSPIYDRDLSLKTACCFQFYYFMYGAGVGDLFVVVKPVSLDLNEILHNHKYLIKFKKNGNQNNIWNEAHFNIEELEEDFQILFVAKSGRGQLSDIAVDDVKLLTGDDCKALDNKNAENYLHEEYVSTTYESIFEMQSCVGHCFESPGSGIIRISKHLQGLCNCDTDCEDNETCCPDFRAVCLNELFSQSTPLVELNDATEHSETKRSSSTALPSTTARTTSATTIVIPKILTSTIATSSAMPNTTIILNTTKTPITTVPITTTTIFSTTTTTLRPKATRTSTTRATSPKITTEHTSFRTTPKRTSLAITSTPKTTFKTSTQNTTANTTPKETITPRSITTLTSTAIPIRTFVRITASKISSDKTTMRQPRPTPQPIEYVMASQSRAKSDYMSFSSLLLYAFFLIILLVLAGAAYKRFGDRAVAWYMIRFKHNAAGDEDTSSVTSTFKSPEPKINGASRNSITSWRNKLKKLSYTKNIMKVPLVEHNDDEDDNDDNELGTNANFALKNNIYTEL